MKDFKERLEAAAAWAGVGESQATIAASLGLNKQTVNRWFQGSEPNSTMLVHIARTWGVSAVWLKSGDGEMLPVNPELADEGARELLRDYMKASPQARQRIREVARVLRKSVVAIAAVIPGFMAPRDADAAISHNVHCAAIFAVARGHITDCMQSLIRWLLSDEIEKRSRFLAFAGF